MDKPFIAYWIGKQKIPEKVKMWYSVNLLWKLFINTACSDFSPAVVKRYPTVNMVLIIEAGWRIYTSVDYSIFGSDTGLSPGRCQAIIQANAGTIIGWFGLDLFNDDTRPSEHISLHTQVNVSQSWFHSLNKLHKSDYIV